MNEANIKNLKKKVANIDNFINKIPCINPQTEYRHDGPIVAFGDIHGDFEALIYLLHGSQIIDTNGNWIAGNTFLVSTGDLVDDCRVGYESVCLNDFATDGYDELSIICFLADLNVQAEAHGGKVLLCMGNHEFMNVSDWTYGEKYVQPYTKQFYGHKRREIFSPGGILAQKLACLMNVLVIVNNWVFLHGGLRLSAFSNKEDLHLANITMKAYLLGDMPKNSARGFLQEIDNNWFFFDRTYSINNYETNDSPVCVEYERVKKVLGMPSLKMVVGHTPTPAPNSICNGQIFRIDTTMSRAFGTKDHPKGRLFSLLIYGDKVNMLSPRAPGRKFTVFNSEDYAKYLEKKGERSRTYTPFQIVEDMSDKLNKKMSKHLEEMGNSSNLDDAFL